jgi:hypothetical protein
MTYGVINKPFVSAIDPIIDTREINKLITDIQNEDALTEIMQLGDRKKPIETGQPIYYTFVNESLFKSVAVSSVTSGNNSTQVVIVLTAATSGVTKVQDIIKFTDNDNGIVTAVSTASGVDTLTVKSVSGANITVTAADVLAIISVAMGEMSSAPAAARFGLTRYSNKYQIFSVTSTITDVQNAATVEVTVDGSPKIIVKDHLEKRILLKGLINAAFIGGDMSVTTFSDQNPILTDQNSGGGAVQTTRGVDKYTELYGFTLNTGGGNYTLGAVDNALDVLTAQRAPLEYLVIGGKSARRKVDTMWKNLGSSGITSARMMVDGKEIDFEVDRVSYGGYSLNYATMPILDHPTLFSQVVISKSLYYIPFNKQVKVEGGGTQPAIQVRYVPGQSPFGNGMIDESYDGAISPVNPVGTVRKWLTNWVTSQGLEVLGSSFLLRQQVN